MEKVTLETLYKCYNIKMEELLVNPIDLNKEKLLNTDLNVNINKLPLIIRITTTTAQK